MFVNQVQLVGRIERVLPPKDFQSGDTMLIIEIATKEDSGIYTHRVSMLNDTVDFFLHNFDVGMFIRIEGKLLPRLMNKDNPNSPMFFDIRCTKCSNVDIDSDAEPEFKEENQELATSIAPSNQTDSPFMVCSPSIPITTNSQHTNDQFSNEVGGSTDFNNFGMGDSSVEYLNGAPIDPNLPFYPQNGRYK